MDAITMIEERRSVRKFKEEKVDRALVSEIVSAATFSPTWANTQIVRYTVIDNKEMLLKLGAECFNDFLPNGAIFSTAAGAFVVSYVKGKSGCAPDGSYATVKGGGWEMFDAGIATQTLCLASYAKGVGTVILGLFDENKIAELIGLSKDQTVATIIPYGYEVKHTVTANRKPLEEVLSFL